MSGSSGSEVDSEAVSPETILAVIQSLSGEAAYTSGESKLLRGVFVEE